MDNYISAAILGIVQGVTEFIPISSSLHIIIARKLGANPPFFNESFDVLLQLASLMALSLIRYDLIKNSIMTLHKNQDSRNLAINLILGVTPVVLITLLLPSMEFTKHSDIAIYSLAVGGVVMILADRIKPKYSHHNFRNVTKVQSIIIGIFQAIAIIPGISRSGSTITGGLLLKLNRNTIVEFSFLLAIPTMAMASGYKLLKHYDDITYEALPYISIGFITSFITSYICAEFFINFLKRYGITIFGIYRIILSAILLLYPII